MSRLRSPLSAFFGFTFGISFVLSLALIYSTGTIISVGRLGVAVLSFAAGILLTLLRYRETGFRTWSFLSSRTEAIAEFLISVGIGLLVGITRRSDISPTTDLIFFMILSFLGTYTGGGIALLILGKRINFHFRNALTGAFIACVISIVIIYGIVWVRDSMTPTIERLRDPAWQGFSGILSVMALVISVIGLRRGSN